MAEHLITLALESEEDTNRLARCLAAALMAGDTILLEGPIGAGKTHFCRAFIRARLGREEDVPSPTFTLVQTYDADVEIWHADLYRLTHPDEAAELGLDEAFERAICLVEWPDRLGSHAPSNAISLNLAQNGEGRLAKINLGDRPAAAAAVRHQFDGTDRRSSCNELLKSAGWANAARLPLAGDASARRYDRLTLNGKSRILMDAPPGIADDVSAFVRLSRHLLQIGVSAPVIHAQDIINGFLVIEDFGDRVFARLMTDDPHHEIALYCAAIDVLTRVQSNPPPSDLPDLTAKGWAEATSLVLDWYRFGMTGDKPDTKTFVLTLEDTLASLADGPRVMILRDYHAENLMWLPERQGLSQVGVLDFQLGQMGQPGYDVVSLLQDARRDVSPDIEREMIRRFLDASGHSEGNFMPSYAALGAQRALRILGIFARLCLVSGKPGYVDMIPRVWHHLQKNLAHPQLTRLRQLCDVLLPKPTEENLNRIRVQCGNFL